MSNLFRTNTVQNLVNSKAKLFDLNMSLITLDQQTTTFLDYLKNGVITKDDCLLLLSDMFLDYSFKNKELPEKARIILNAQKLINQFDRNLYLEIKSWLYTYQNYDFVSIS